MKYFVKPVKKTIEYRPMPDSKISQFGQSISSQTWDNVFNQTDVNLKVEAFHKILRGEYEQIFTEKVVSFSPHDQKWFTPSLKLLHHKMKH